MASLDPVLNAYRARILALEGDTDEAIRVMEVAMEGSAPSSRRLLRLGQMQREGGRLREARETLELAVRLDPADAESHTSWPWFAACHRPETSWRPP